MSAITKRRKISGAFYDYMISRGSTFAFIGFFIFGLVLGSIYAISSGEGAELLRSIVSNDLSMQLTRSFTEILITSLSGFAGIFIIIYLCINSSKGVLLIYVVPLIHGISLGSLITAAIYKSGYGALSYILCCIFIPKVIETLLLLSVCNKTARYCKEHFLGQAARKGRGDSFPIMLYFIVFAMYFLLESLLIYIFR